MVDLSAEAGTPHRPRSWSSEVPRLLLVAGVLARCGSLFVQLQLPLEADAREALLLARSFTLAEPWASSLREPLWIALVKVTTGPFGYSIVVLRVVTTLLSIAALFATWSLLQSRLSPPVARVALAIVSLNGILVLSAARGLREELVMLLVITGLGAAIRPRPQLAVVAGVVGALSIVRWETALLSIAVLACAAFLRRVPAAVAVGAVVAVAVLAGPWLASNAARYDDPLVHSNQHASFWHRVYLRDTTGRDVGPRSITWAEFYLDDLGPRDALARAGTGATMLARDVVADGIQPLSDRWLDRNVDSPVLRRAGLATNAVTPWLASAVWAAAIAGLALRRRPLHPLLVVSGAMAVAGWLAYGVLRRLSYFDQRFVVFTVPLAAVVLAEGLVALRSCQRNVHSAELLDQAATSPS